MKKFILMTLIVSIVAVLPLLSCNGTAGDGGNGIQNEPVGTGNETPDDAANGADGEAAAELTFPELPDVNFGGHEFRILSVADDFAGWILTQLTAEGETGVALNDAIFRRNRRMEDRFGFNLVHIPAVNPAGVLNGLRTSIQEGSDDFDLGMLLPNHALTLAQEGLLTPIDTIPNIDLSKPWWDQDMIRDFSIGNRVFFTSGDFSLNQYSVTIGMFFNTRLHADLGLDCPYQLVRDGKWTLENFAAMGRAALRDLNGDGIFDYNDQWGLVGVGHVYIIGFVVGMGERYVIKDADDIPALNITSQGFINRFLDLFDLLTEPWVFNNQSSDRRRGGSVVPPEELFMSNQSLFWSPVMNTAVQLRAMDADFGILPQPKLNEQQEHHIAGTNVLHVMGIPLTSADLDRTGVILEALNAESRLTVLDVYFNTMLVNQLLTRDEESAAMLDIIFANRVYETGRLMWDPEIAVPLSNALRDYDRNIASLIEAREPVAVAAIENAVRAFLEN